eukprot:31989_6
MPLKAAIESASDTNLPGVPVNTSATWKGWDMNFWILRARATVILSSSDNSSIPRMAIISCKFLFWRVFCTWRARLCSSPTTRGSSMREVEVEGVDSRVDAELRNAAREHSRSVQVSKGSSRRRVGQIVGRHVDCLDRGDGALLVRGNALLETTQIGGERGLISYSRGDTAEKRRHLRVGLGEAEDVVNEE